MLANLVYSILTFVIFFSAIILIFMIKAHFDRDTFRTNTNYALEAARRQQMRMLADLEDLDREDVGDDTLGMLNQNNND